MHNNKYFKRWYMNDFIGRLGTFGICSLSMRKGPTIDSFGETFQVIRRTSPSTK